MEEDFLKRIRPINPERGKVVENQKKSKTNHTVPLVKIVKPHVHTPTQQTQK